MADVVDEAVANVRELGPFEAYRAWRPRQSARHERDGDRCPDERRHGRRRQGHGRREELREIARTLLARVTLRVIIGGGRAPRRAAGVRHDPAEADRLIFDARCVHNLVTY